MLDSKIAPGAYVVAVSGGVDSVALLDMLVKLPRVQIVVAHVDHGIREDSDQDRKFVEHLANGYHLPFFYSEAHLGAAASEELARKVRYDFLNKINEQTNSKAIITAHHQDDLLETIILNILRGTKRKGITALKNREGILRPLLEIPKIELYDYAKKHNLSWREDSTNLDTKYSRNWIRHKVIPRLSARQRAQLLSEHQNLSLLNKEIDDAIDQTFFENIQNNELSRKKFINLPHEVATEVCAMWLRKNNFTDFDRRTIEKLTVDLKRLQVGKMVTITGATLQISKDFFIFNSSQK
jgi:tRNA(Ile)-lysidine synthase